MEKFAPPPVRRWLGACLFATVLATTLAATPAGVAVLRAAPWSPGDTVREGAGEFEVFVCAARLQRDHRVAGLVGVGNRRGPPPVAANPASPSLTELAAVRAHLQPFRAAFALASAPRVASK